MAETCGYPKRYQRRSREGKKRIFTHRGSAYGLRSRLNRPETLNKVQQELEYNKG